MDLAFDAEIGMLYLIETETGCFFGCERPADNVDDT